MAFYPFHQVKGEFQGQIGEYKKLLDMRAARIHKLEMQLRESTYGQVSKNVNVSNLMSQTVHTPSGQSLFEIHILQANLTKEFLVKLGKCSTVWKLRIFSLTCLAKISSNQRFY